MTEELKPIDVTRFTVTENGNVIRKEAIMDMTLAEWIVKAIETIRSGVADKLEKNNVKVYQCGNVIRIDIKE